MNNLQIINHQSQRVLTTAQLAEAFGTDNRRISENFARNADRYIIGKHYFILEGEEKRSFLNHTQIADGLKNAAAIYLWTEKGTWLHAKSLNTDQAWEAYEMLVDDYYRVKEQAAAPQMTQAEIIAAIANQNVETERRIAQLESGLNEAAKTLETVKETFLQRDEDWRKQINGMMNGASFRAGKGYRELRNESYTILEQRARCDLNARLRNLTKRLEEAGATKTQIREANKMDVIENDPKLKEIYSTVVRELSLGSLSGR